MISGACRGLGLGNLVTVAMGMTEELLVTMQVTRYGPPTRYLRIEGLGRSWGRLVIDRMFTIYKVHLVFLEYSDFLFLDLN